MMFCIAGDCYDKLPDDYFGNYSSNARYCNWTCDAWHKTENCDTKWEIYEECVTKPYGKIKDYCRRSCNMCGNQPFTHKNI